MAVTISWAATGVMMDVMISVPVAAVAVTEVKGPDVYRR